MNKTKKEIREGINMIKVCCVCVYENVSDETH